MAVDPSIALGFRGVEAPNPLTAYGQVAQIQNAQNQNALAQYQLSAAKRTDEQQNALNALYAQHLNPETGQVNMKGLVGGLAAAGQGSLIPAQLAKEQEMQTKAATLQKTNIETAAKQAEMLSQIELDVAQHPSDARITKSLEDIQLAPFFSPQQKAAAEAKMRELLALPMDKRQAYIGTPGAKAGDVMQQQSAAALLAEQKRAHDMADARARENIQIARDRLAKDHAMLDPTEQAAISKAIIEGRLDPNKINGRNAKMMAQTLIAKPDINIKDLGIEAAGAGAAERSLATVSAKMTTAATEATKMIGIASDISNKIDRTQYPTINAIQNAVSKGTGGEEIVKLNTALNAVINSYARAISPTGNPTVSDKTHAREIINANYSSGQLGAVLDVMKQEMASASEATSETRAKLKAERTGAAKPAPATGAKFLGFE